MDEAATNGGAGETPGRGGDLGLPLRPEERPPDAVADRLLAPMLEACQQQQEWPAKVAAAIYAVVDFAMTDPAAAQAALLPPPDHRGGEAYPQMIDYFAGLLQASGAQRLPVSSERALVAGIATVIATHVRAGRADRLAEIAPGLVQFALLPYLGFAEAKRWSTRP